MKFSLHELGKIAGVCWGSVPVSSVLTAVGLLGCGDVQGGAVDDTQEPLIFGSNDIRDVYVPGDKNLTALARRTTVSMIANGRIDATDPDHVQILANSMRQTRYKVDLAQDETAGLCPGEPFYDESVAAACSASLIGEDLVLLAGHCVDKPDACANYGYVFGFYRDSATQIHNITSDDVFTCKEIVVQKNDGVLDYAVVRLDRAAGKRFVTPPVRTQPSALTVGTSVGMSGNPLAVTTKVVDRGLVLNNGAPELAVWRTNVDGYGGNSGSGVYDTTGYALSGILARGDGRHFDWDANKTCVTGRVCTEDASDCYAFDAVYAHQAVAALCAKEPLNALCGPQNQLQFDALETASAYTHTRNHWVYVDAGSALDVNTCSGQGGTASGDTYLRLFDNEGIEVASNDDSCGLGSAFQFTASTRGLYELSAGCYSDLSCSGTVSWKVLRPEVYLEAECPKTTRGAFGTSSSSIGGYSGRGYITSAGNTTLVSRSTDFATYEVNVPTNQFQVHFRIQTENSNLRDSWFWRVDGGPWKTENNHPSAAFIWVTGSASVALSGKHVIEVANRESGLHLDKLAVLPVGTPAPQGTGGNATNCTL